MIHVSMYCSSVADPGGIRGAQAPTHCSKVMETILVLRNLSAETIDLLLSLLKVSHPFWGHFHIRQVKGVPPLGSPFSTKIPEQGVKFG